MSCHWNKTVRWISIFILCVIGWVSLYLVEVPLSVSFQVDLGSSTKPAAISAVRTKDANSTHMSRIHNQTHLPLAEKPKKIVSNKKLCRQLEKPELFREHGFSDEVYRLDQQYELTRAALRTGWVPGKVQASWVSKITEAKEPITIMALGGSFTRGHGCGETPEQDEKSECSWPARLQRWWEVHFSKDGDIHPAPRLIHMGEHGTGSVNALLQMGVILKSIPHKPDLILIDYLVNDLFFDEEEGFFAFESLLITIRDLLPQTQILVLTAGCNMCIESEIVDRHRKIAQFYDIPMVDYAAMVQFHNQRNPGVEDEPDLLWPTTDPEYEGESPFTKVDAPWPNFVPAVTVTNTHDTCCANNHPPWPVHQYVADSVAHAIIQMLSQEVKCEQTGSPSEITPQHYHSQEELDRYPVCHNPLTFHDAELSPHGVNTNNTGWSLYEDRPGRPGWITEEIGSTLRFPVQFGDQPVLAITYLRSYENIGEADVRLHSNKKSKKSKKEQEPWLYMPIIMEGHWEKHVSLPETMFFVYTDPRFYEPLKSKGWITEDFLKPYWKEGKEGQIHNVEIFLESGSKFKIMRVASC